MEYAITKYTEYKKSFDRTSIDKTSVIVYKHK